MPSGPLDHQRGADIWLQRQVYPEDPVVREQLAVILWRQADGSMLISAVG